MSFSTVSRILKFIRQNDDTTSVFQWKDRKGHTNLGEGGGGEGKSDRERRGSHYQHEEPAERNVRKMTCNEDLVRSADK